MSRIQLEMALDDIREEIRTKGLDKRSTNRPKEDIMKKVKAEAVEVKSKGGGYSAADMAEALGVSSTDLRKALRDAGVKKPGASWNWETKKAASEAQAAAKEQLKSGSKKSDKKAPAKAVAKAPAKAAPKKVKKARKVAEAEENLDE